MKLRLASNLPVYVYMGGRSITLDCWTVLVVLSTATTLCMSPHFPSCKWEGLFLQSNCRGSVGSLNGGTYLYCNDLWC